MGNFECPERRHLLDLAFEGLQVGVNSLRRENVHVVTHVARGRPVGLNEISKITIAVFHKAGFALEVWVLLRKVLTPSEVHAEIIANVHDGRVFRVHVDLL